MWDMMFRSQTIHGMRDRVERFAARAVGPEKSAAASSLAQVEPWLRPDGIIVFRRMDKGTDDVGVPFPVAMNYPASVEAAKRRDNLLKAMIEDFDRPVLLCGHNDNTPPPPLAFRLLFAGERLVRRGWRGWVIREKRWEPMGEVRLYADESVHAVLRIFIFNRGKTDAPDRYTFTGAFPSLLALLREEASLDRPAGKGAACTA